MGIWVDGAVECLKSRCRFCGGLGSFGFGTEGCALDPGNLYFSRLAYPLSYFLQTTEGKQRKYVGDEIIAELPYIRDTCRRAKVEHSAFQLLIVNEKQL